MVVDFPCILDKSSEEAKGANGCFVVEFFGLVLGVLIFVYVGSKCCLCKANELEEDFSASRRLRVGSEDEEGQSVGDMGQIVVDFEVGLIGHGEQEAV